MSGRSRFCFRTNESSRVNRVHPDKVHTCTGWSAFRAGLSNAVRYRWVLAILLIANLASALPLAVLPALGLVAELGHRPAIRQAADGVDAWLVVETLMSPLSGPALGESGGWPEVARRLRQGTLLGLLTVAALPLVAWLPAAFLSGGVLLTYADDAPQLSQHKRELRPDERDSRVNGSSHGSGSFPCEGKLSGSFHWRRFLWGCWHWFGPFLLLGAVQGFVSVVVLVPAIGAAAVAAATVGGWLAWVIVPVLILVVVLWLALTEYTRVVAVVEGAASLPFVREGTQNVFQAFAGALRFVFRHPLPVAGLYGLALLLLGTLHVLFRQGLMPRLPLDRWLLVLLVQQAFILARLWARLVRLAGGVALYQGCTEKRADIQAGG